MKTDNHEDSGTYAKLVCESMADDEVQLVKFVREGASTVIMANFQTHPHLLTDSTSTIATSDIVGVFRNELKASLEGGVLRAPFSGRVAYSLNLTQGSRLEASLPFCYIADDNRLTLAGPDMPQYFFDNADDAYIITGSSECRFLLLDETQREEMTPNVSGVGYYLPVDDQGNPIPLTLGQSAQLCVIRDLTENALLIPYAAIQKDGEQQYVYVYENGNKVRRDITTGLWHNGMAHVTSGLEEGAYVYVG
jgi:hypothetical protein